MTPSPTLLLIVLVGAVIGGGVVLLVHALTRHEVSAVAKPPSSLGRRLRSFGSRLPVAQPVNPIVTAPYLSFISFTKALLPLMSGATIIHGPFFERSPRSWASECAVDFFSCTPSSE